MNENENKSNLIFFLLFTELLWLGFFYYTMCMYINYIIQIYLC